MLEFTAPTLLAIALIIYTVAFYSAEYEFDERPEQFDELFSGEERVDCGTSWTNWIDQTQGLSNPCPEGCYRGVTITKKYRMRGIFPPWPQSKRELQCWTR